MSNYAQFSFDATDSDSTLKFTKRQGDPMVTIDIVVRPFTLAIRKHGIVKGYYNQDDEFDVRVDEVYQRNSDETHILFAPIGQELVDKLVTAWRVVIFKDQYEINAHWARLTTLGNTK